MSKIKVNEIEAQSGTTIEAQSNVEIGTDASPKALTVKGNEVVEGTFEAAGIGSNNDPGAISGALTLTNIKQASVDGGNVTLRESSGAGTLVQAGFLKMYLDDGTEIYVPYFTAHAGS